MPLHSCVQTLTGMDVMPIKILYVDNIVKDMTGKITFVGEVVPQIPTFEELMSRVRVV